MRARQDDDKMDAVEQSRIFKERRERYVMVALTQAMTNCQANPFSHSGHLGWRGQGLLRSPGVSSSVDDSCGILLRRQLWPY